MLSVQNGGIDSAQSFRESGFQLKKDSLFDYITFFTSFEAVKEAIYQFYAYVEPVLTDPNET